LAYVLDWDLEQVCKDFHASACAGCAFVVHEEGYDTACFVDFYGFDVLSAYV
jgi:hypothetical protein